MKLNPTPILTLTLLIDKGYALKFADDSKIFGKVITPVDRLQLQQDHDALCKWAQDWQMKFNVSKCKVMHTGPGNTNDSYFMNGLNTVTEHKDLGVIISSNLKVADHCQQRKQDAGNEQTHYQTQEYNSYGSALQKSG